MKEDDADPEPNQYKRQHPIAEAREQILGEAFEDLRGVSVHATADVLCSKGQAPAQTVGLDLPSQCDIVYGVSTHGRIAADLIVGRAPEEHVLSVRGAEGVRAYTVGQRQR